MDLDLTLVRSFVATAEERHFGRAAARLFVTQQALSKRIGRLENHLGATLLTRTTRGVSLTEAGLRFLDPARRALDAADLAVAAVRQEERMLRADVVDDRLSPMRLIRRLIDERPEVPLNLTARQSLSAALPALARGEIDAAFGRPYDLAGTWPKGLAHRLVRLEPVRALVTPGHPLADRPALDLAELAEHGIWMPAFAERSEWAGWVRELTERFGIPLVEAGPAIGEDHFAEQMWQYRARASLGGADVSYAYTPDIRTIPLANPEPLHAWCLVWRADDRHPLVSRLLELAREEAGAWLAYDPATQWLPDADLPLLD
ncbi:LysR family transcriptional regulator [Amycolatopsis anabasis]|uniref:LysR family transcriptional regulator n=1 Tax=Amycolatopsis anabasis TaxID=1840409 RepID=UPI00131BEA4F|nr:LysR family transcriptional regulator [Amycolatopsis anabasis]